MFLRDLFKFSIVFFTLQPYFETTKRFNLRNVHNFDQNKCLNIQKADETPCAFAAIFSFRKNHKQ